MSSHTAARRGPLSSLVRSSRLRVALLVVVVLSAGATVASVRTLATFTAADQAPASFSAGRIFPGIRTTPGFVVHDASGGGAEIDRTSPFAIVGDGRTTPTTSWSTAFAANRYLEFDLNAPLPGAVPASGVTFRLTVASASPSGTACGYVNVRRISDDASLATYGSPGSPLGCVTGTTPATLVLPLPVVGSTDAANDLRVRIYGRDTAGTGSVIDEAVVTGSTPYSTFTLYPVRFTDAASSTPVSAPWELDGP